ncbi:unnamed protein product [Clavelina lepadiformis]|uniref:Uncharacterized protein n=1 Tax=Clavelina lepadiformis TaxID=159417 RepID=A0ABP0G8C9_CLALP
MDVRLLRVGNIASFRSSNISTSKLGRLPPTSVGRPNDDGGAVSAHHNTTLRLFGSGLNAGSYVRVVFAEDSLTFGESCDDWKFYLQPQSDNSATIAVNIK